MPTPVELQQLLGAARQQILAGQIDRARHTSDRLLSHAPDYAAALIQRSRLESIADNYRQASRFASLASRASPLGKQEVLLLVNRLKAFNRIAELREVVARVPPALLADPDVANLLTFIYRILGEPATALRYAEQGLATAPGHPSLQTALALARLNLGRFDEARQALDACLATHPFNAQAWWHLARLPDAGDRARHVDGLRRALSGARDPRDRALVGYALHRILDGMGDHAGAAQALGDACGAMRSAIQYSADEDGALFAQLKALPPRTHGQDDGCAPFVPVFIVGMHRSGTTLLEQMLGGSEDVHAAGELYDFTSQLRHAADHHCNFEVDQEIVSRSPGFDYGEIGRGYLESVAWRRSGQRFVTDKLPSNFRNLHFILQALPGAKVLHMVRDPVETCFSNLREPFSETTCRFSNDQHELARYYREYASLMVHWHQRFPGRILDVDYAALAGNPAAEMAKVADYLGLALSPDMLGTAGRTRSVNTASAVQVRRAPTLPSTPKWAAYRDHLAPLLAALGTG